MDARNMIGRALGAAGYKLMQLSRKALEDPSRGPSLSGDRDVEWAWCLGGLRSEPGRILDLGAGSGILSLAAAFHGHEVVSVDLEPCSFQFSANEIEYVQGDFNRMTFEDRSFDQILNCSTIEHFGLGGRYGSAADDTADLEAMRTLSRLLRPGGDMLLTIPVGRDDVFAPRHRIYGEERLPRLLEAFAISDEIYWRKNEADRWLRVPREIAIQQLGSPTLYALGLFRLTVR
ncbi:MAG TPA: class I SAM-dependent methyltransferase [Gaiellaceae bacterium]|nr:class I SAM-dependent methyltransferase [Gaiellaceae bacterium]